MMAAPLAFAQQPTQASTRVEKIEVTGSRIQAPELEGASPVAVIRADAGLKAQITMGEADGEATKIYADTFSKDKDFYAFWRRMEAYKQAFSQGGSMVLSPDSDFFRYFNDPSGQLKK